MVVYQNAAPNINQIYNTALNNRDRFTIDGIAGDANHTEGDHTLHSDWSGKLGYPTQGQYHAIDLDSDDAELASLEAWILSEWRNGRLYGIKFFNILNRQWNIQTEAAWQSARAGTIKSSYNDDHHCHLSMENGSVDGDLLERYVNRGGGGGGSGTPPTEGDDDMTPDERGALFNIQGRVEEVYPIKGMLQAIVKALPELGANVGAILEDVQQEGFTDEDRGALKNTQGRAVEVYPIKAKITALEEGQAALNTKVDQILALLQANNPVAPPA